MKSPFETRSKSAGRPEEKATRPLLRSRSFGVGLVVAAPVALALWALIIWAVL